MTSIEEIALRTSFRVCMSVSPLQGGDTDSVVTTKMKPLGFFPHRIPQNHSLSRQFTNQLPVVR